MTKLDTKSKKKSFNELVRAEEGNGFVEKIIIIALFAFVVAAGINIIASGANKKLTDQGSAIEGVNSTIGAAPAGAS